jgi:hypothetical protein
MKKWQGRMTHLFTIPEMVIIKQMHKLLKKLLFLSINRSVKENLLDHVIKCSLQSPTAKESEILKANAESATSTKTASDYLSGLSWLA